MNTLANLTPEQWDDMNRRAEAFEEETRRQLLKERVTAAGIPKRYLAADIETCLQSVREWALRPAGSGLFLYGQQGRGKTYASCAIALDWLHRETVRTAHFATMPELLLQLRATFKDRDGSELDCITSLAGRGLLIIDDLGIHKPGSVRPTIASSVCSHCSTCGDARSYRPS